MIESARTILTVLEIHISPHYIQNSVFEQIIELQPRSFRKFKDIGKFPFNKIFRPYPAITITLL